MEDNQGSGAKQSRDRREDDAERVPFTRLRQLDSDFVLAVALQDQERAFSSLETIESESESDDEPAYDQEDYEFLGGAGLEADQGFPDEDYSDDDDDEDEDMDDDELDVDELTYEELIALGEFIGVEERGIPAKEIASCLRPIVCKTASPAIGGGGGLVDRCVVCQVEYEDGEDLVALRCEHCYHSDCITKWLQIKKCCPICSSEVSSSSTTKNNAN